MAFPASAACWCVYSTGAGGGVHRIIWHWVKGHAGDPGNERADALANKGVPEVAETSGETTESD